MPLTKTVLNRREIVYRYTDSFSGSKIEQHASLIDIRIEETYTGSYAEGTTLTIYFPSSSHKCRHGLPLPEAGDEFIWLLNDLTLDADKDTFHITDLATHSYELPPDCFLSTNPTQEQIAQIIDYYRHSAETNGKECDPTIFDLTDLNQFFRQFYGDNQS